MSEYALIDFRDSVVGRQAYMQGSSLAVWEVMMIARLRRGCGERREAFAMAGSAHSRRSQLRGGLFG